MARQHEITAIIYNKRGRVLSIGKNDYIKTHPLQKKHAVQVGQPYKEHIHAEVAAIIKCRDLSKAYKIKVFRFSADGNPALAKPCAICCSAIEAAGIKHIEHT
jgi:deoxycytidylate deaminase